MLRTSFFFLALFCSLVFDSLAQSTSPTATTTKTDAALEKAKLAMRYLDSNKYNQAAVLFEQAQKLDPKNYVYPYQKAYIHYRIGDYMGALSILKKLPAYKESEDRVYQLLGNSYDLTGNPAKAIESYKAGLQRFPSSGDLHAELGNMCRKENKNKEAIEWYEKGVQADPRCVTNYYRLAQLYCNSVESMWGIIYGEIFINLERNTKRTAEISAILYASYRERIEMKGDSLLSVRFGKEKITVQRKYFDTSLSINSISDVWDRLMLRAALEEKNTGLNSLCNIRTTFLRLYFQQGLQKNYPNPLLEYQERLRNAGFMDAYNHWILVGGDDVGFQVWKIEHEDEWQRFAQWYTKNPLPISKTNYFCRSMWEKR